MEMIASPAVRAALGHATLADDVYASAAARAWNFESAGLVPSASRGRRVANFLLDGACVLVACAFLLAACSVTIGDAWLDGMDGWVKRLLGLAIYFVYCVVFETAYGWTPAKLITRTRVCNADGTSPSFVQILKRSAIRMIPLEALSWVGRHPLGWHDRWSATRVVVEMRSPAHPHVIRAQADETFAPASTLSRIAAPL